MNHLFRFSILLCFCLSGCFTSTGNLQPSYGTVTYMLDFREYANKGFLFTPFDYQGVYEPIGIVRIEVIPHVYDKGTEDPLPGVEYREIYIDEFMEVIRPEDALRRAYEEAISLGADAITDLDIEAEQYSNQVNSSYTITGFAIKRQ